MSSLKTRFAPSPSGLIHLGNLRVALFSKLLALKHSGSFLLRIEDTDASRSDSYFVFLLKKTLLSMGLMWNEGVSFELEETSDTSLFYQTQRLDIYSKYFSQLLAEHKIYPCFCTNERLDLLKQSQIKQSLPPRYDGRCLSLSEDERKARLEIQKSYVWRLYVEPNIKIEFDDIIRGKRHFNTNHFSDFIIKRSDQTYSFIFVNAVDDAEMNITHVIRGEDHLSNTPRQILLQQYLGFPSLQYAHMGLICDHEGHPLSKRLGNFSISKWLERGYLPQAILNMLVRIGCDLASDEMLSLEAMAKAFDLKQLKSGNAQFSENQLIYWQKKALGLLSDQSLLDWLSCDFQVLFPEKSFKQKVLFCQLLREVAHDYEQANAWLRRLQTFTHNDEEIKKQKDLLTSEEIAFIVALPDMYAQSNDWNEFLSVQKTQYNIMPKRRFLLLRQALTGALEGPQLSTWETLLGREEVKNRLRQFVFLVK